jgi:hypothetical protein
MARRRSRPVTRARNSCNLHKSQVASDASRNGTVTRQRMHPARSRNSADIQSRYCRIGEAEHAAEARPHGRRRRQPGHAATAKRVNDPSRVATHGVALWSAGHS